VDLATFRWLLTEEGQQLLHLATTIADEYPDAFAAATRLREHASPDQAAAALTQVRLRARAVEKFGPDAHRMYFLSDALEQATRRRVARHRAVRVALSDPESVLDVGCGIGGDLTAFAEAGLTVAGVDLDPLRAAIAAANLRALGLPGAVSFADASTMDLSAFGVVFADPARRSAKGRTFNPHDFTPPWEFVESLLTRPSCVKLAPGLPHSIVPEGVEAEWISDDGELKEACLWSVELATAARRATVIRRVGMATLTSDDDPGTAEVRPPQRFLYEPDDAVIRAGLVTAVAPLVEGALLDRRIAYLTSEASSATPFARGYEILEELPFAEKRLRAALRERGIGVLEIKKRGIAVTPEQLRKRLRLHGPNEATLVLTRHANKAIALLCRPLP
jgi:SAM-dependent methyltransferase